MKYTYYLHLYLSLETSPTTSTTTTTSITTTTTTITTPTTTSVKKGKCCIKYHQAIIWEPSACWPARYLLLQDPSRAASSIAQCQQEGLLNCTLVTYNVTSLHRGDLVTLLPGLGVVLEVSRALYCVLSCNNPHVQVTKVPPNLPRQLVQRIQFKVTSGGEGDGSVSFNTGEDQSWE